MVHPLTSCHLWETSDARLAARLLAPAASPHIGMLVRIPIGRCFLHCLLDLLPTLKSPSFEGQRLEGLPPRLDQVSISRSSRLEDELPARIGQVEEEHIHGSMHAQI